MLFADTGYIGLEAALDYCSYGDCNCKWIWIDGTRFDFAHSSVIDPSQFVYGNTGGCGVLVEGQAYQSQLCDQPRSYFCHFAEMGDAHAMEIVECGTCEPERCNGVILSYICFFF